MDGQGNEILIQIQFGLLEERRKAISLDFIHMEFFFFFTEKEVSFTYFDPGALLRITHHLGGKECTSILGRHKLRSCVIWCHQSPHHLN